MDFRRSFCARSIAWEFARLTLGFMAALTADVAVSSHWINGAGGDYSDPDSWTGGVPNAVGAVADFSTLNLNGDVSVTLNSNVILGSLRFGDTNTGSPGTWELRTDNVPTSVITLNDGGSKPTITVNPLAPTTFDDAYVGHSLAGIMGFTKLGGGILTLGIGTANTITGGVDVNAGVLRLMATVPNQAINLGNGTRLETATGLAVAGAAVGGANVTVRSTFAAATRVGGFAATANTGSTMNLQINGTGRFEITRDWTGYNAFNITGLPGQQRSAQLNLNDGGGNSANVALWQGIPLSLDNVVLQMRTNSRGNTVPIGELNGTSTATLRGGDVGSAARYQIGANNTSTTFAGRIEDGIGGLVIDKVGTGTLTLAGINTYTGNTTVQAGAISVNNAFFANGADIIIANGAILNLNHSVTDVIRSLYLGGVPQAPGIYGVGALGASFFSGAGMLNVMMLGPPQSAADFDEDGDVDGDDLARWKTNFGLAAAATHLQGNADGDQDVDGADFLTWQRQLGPSSAVSGNVPVPEPASSLLVVAAAAGFRSLRGRTRQELIAACNGSTMDP